MPVAVKVFQILLEHLRLLSLVRWWFLSEALSHTNRILCLLDFTLKLIKRFLVGGTRHSCMLFSILASLV